MISPDVLSAASLAVAVLVAIGGGLLRYAVHHDDREIDRRLGVAETCLAGLEARSTEQGLRDSDLDKQIALVAQAHETTRALLLEIRSELMPRHEWDTRNDATDAQIREIRDLLGAGLRPVRANGGEHDDESLGRRARLLRGLRARRRARARPRRHERGERRAHRRVGGRSKTRCSPTPNGGSRAARRPMRHVGRRRRTRRTRRRRTGSSGSIA